MSVRNGSQLTGVPWHLHLAGHTSATHTFQVLLLIRMDLVGQPLIPARAGACALPVRSRTQFENENLKFLIADRSDRSKMSLQCHMCAVTVPLSSPAAYTAPECAEGALFRRSPTESHEAFWDTFCYTHTTRPFLACLRWPRWLIT